MLVKRNSYSAMKIQHDAQNGSNDFVHRAYTPDDMSDSPEWQFDTLCIKYS